MVDGALVLNTMWTMFWASDCDICTDYMVKKKQKAISSDQTTDSGKTETAFKHSLPDQGKGRITNTW